MDDQLEFAKKVSEIYTNATDPKLIFDRLINNEEAKQAMLDAAKKGENDILISKLEQHEACVLDEYILNIQDKSSSYGLYYINAHKELRYMVHKLNEGQQEQQEQQQLFDQDFAKMISKTYGEETDPKHILERLINTENARNKIIDSSKKGENDVHIAYLEKHEVNVLYKYLKDSKEESPYGYYYVDKLFIQKELRYNIIKLKEEEQPKSIVDPEYAKKLYDTIYISPEELLRAIFDANRDKLLKCAERRQYDLNFRDLTEYEYHLLKKYLKDCKQPTTYGEIYIKEYNVHNSELHYKITIKK